jgi:predicted O-methyltransferase YrrM
MTLREFVDLCRLKELYDGFSPLSAIDVQGWGSKHRIFQNTLEQCRPSTIIEVGSWKGASAIHMAEIADRLGLDVTILCIDTWLGGNRAYVDHTYIEDTLPRGGCLRLLQVFMTNVFHHGLQDRVFPMPSTSLDAADSLAFKRVTADVIYIDAGHSECEVRQDIEAYWPILRPGGVMIGDDYNADAWPGVVKAANDFSKRVGSPIEDKGNKFVLRKRV